MTPSQTRSKRQASRGQGSEVAGADTAVLADCRQRIRLEHGQQRLGKLQGRAAATRRELIDAHGEHRPHPFRCAQGTCGSGVTAQERAGVLVAIPYQGVPIRADTGGPAVERALTEKPLSPLMRRDDALASSRRQDGAVAAMRYGDDVGSGQRTTVEFDHDGSSLSLRLIGSR